MFIVHVVTLVSPTGAYGGPVRVALNQLSELQRRGHKVLLVAGQADFVGEPPSQIDGVPVALFPVHRLSNRSVFGTLISPMMVKYLIKVMAEIDVLHLHLARDFIMIPAALVASVARKPFFVQSHGMLARSPRTIIKVLDCSMVNPLIKNAKGVFYLTSFERSQLSSLYPSIKKRLSKLVNGVRDSEDLDVSWPEQLTFLFLGRLHPRKNPILFVEAAIQRLAAGSEAMFLMAGPDEGELGRCISAIQAAGVPERVQYIGSLSYEETAPLMTKSSVFVLPSVNEPFPMTVLEAMSHGLPVIITNSNGLSGPVRDSSAGVVVEAGSNGVAAAMRDLERERGLVDKMSNEARNLIRSDYTITSVVSQLEIYYNSK